MQSLEVCEARRYHRALYILVGNQTAVHKTADLSSAWYRIVRCSDAKEWLLNSDSTAQRFQLRLLLQRMIQLENNTWVLGTRRRSGLMSPGRLASLYRCTRIQRVQEKIVGHGGSNDVRAWRCFNALRRIRSCVRNMASSFCALSRRSFAKGL
ncbi:hypothetical protein HBH56_155340 [Parastagonospora nodorum]|uniref:Uncharacterized protein n=1 Tax=Phaeosphaeria nodorum (strain SN15 / ATCC MYA-4574 / FGSC 10173) TaxID=321614 RepID=A0A7U2F1G5_PHANO|nr:hypothetical protein HBH56_155340 [Parastagonospora nodorum]QRC95868.1 hypothetical protein JI435_408030 [Parastagonospora nodorum SN15]KAH3926775.1 hypothetical protein HBH54_162350 [Parastagonospora nodorum]KAH3943243.1 hypothetical protein HBH53_176800 [Parastagonospora nodorum]KAH4029350.1 hypothetical protein HBI09_132150 [Parastagonospora nodorum]